MKDFGRRYLPFTLSIIIVSTLVISSCASRKMAKFGLSKHFDASQETMIMNGEGSDPMRVYKINNREDSILLRTSSEMVIPDAEDVVLTNFIDRLLSTVQDSMSMGVGIAAPQVGILKNIIWVQRFDKDEFPFEYYLNPVITHYSQEKQDCREGCLSIPDRSDTTRIRAETIVIRHDLMEGNTVNDTISGFTAVIFQHEIDHLNGILYLDHLEKEMKQ